MNLFKYLLIAIYALTSTVAYGDAVIFSGSDVKTLKANIDLYGQSKIMSGTVNPQSSATSAPKGTLYLNSSTGDLYRKLDAGSSTNWSLVGSGGSAGFNVLKNSNPDMEAGTTNWTASGGTLAAASSTNILLDRGSLTWDSGSAGQTLSSASIAVPEGLKGANGVASILIKVPSGTATHVLEVYDGTNIIATQTVTSSALRALTQVNFIWPTSGSLLLRLKSVASDEPLIAIDQAFLGDATNVSNTSQATLYGAVTINSCASNWSTTSTTITDPGVNTSCVYNVSGAATAPSTQLPAVTFNNLPAGNYQVLVTGYHLMHAGGASSRGSTSILSDGTTNVSESTLFTATDIGQKNTPVTNAGNFSYTSAQSSVTFKVRLAAISGGTASIAPTAAGVNIYVYRFPSASEQAVNANQSGWRVDANISGANISLGTAAQTAYTGMSNGSLTLSNATGNNVLTAQIACDSTTAPSGTTCSAVNEMNGISFNLPVAGDVRACVSFTHNISNGAGGATNTYFEIVETAPNAQTILQEGKSRIGSGYNVASNQHYTPLTVCGTFTFASTGQKVLRLFFEQEVGGTVTSSQVLADAQASSGQRDIHWEVYPINQGIPAPVLVGSVTSSSSGGERAVRAVLNCDASSAITSQAGSWISSVGNISSGACALTLASGTFSAAPTCVGSGTSGSKPILEFTASSATAVSMSCFTDAGSNCSAYDANVICMGPR